jgi:hypothetical protein
MPYSEDDARQVLLDRRGHLTRNIFAGAKLQFTNAAIADYAAFTLKDVYSVQSGISAAKTAVATGAAAPPGAVSSFVKGIFNVDDVKSLMVNVGVPHGITQSVESFLGVLPGFASVQSGLTAMVHLGKAANHAWVKHQVESKESALRSGDPKAALAAVARIIGRARDKSGTKAAINASHAAATAAGFFVDGGAVSGPVAGVLKTFASLSYRMFLLGRDMDEKYWANRLLADPQSIDVGVFTVAPILGCYVITEATAFDILNFLVGEMGQDGWMSKVESMIPDMVYVQDTAAQYARDSSLQMSGLKTDMFKYRGLTRSERLKLWIKKKLGAK